MRKAIVLCGGSGSRLYPLSAVGNKCLLPIYDKPCLFLIIETLKQAGFDEFFFVVNLQDPSHSQIIAAVIKELGTQAQIGFQDGAKGIADAIKVARTWANQDPVGVILSDNIFEDNLKLACDEFFANPIGARIFCKKVKTPEKYGVVEFKNKKVVSIEEKPQNPKSSFVQTGFYLYDSQVWHWLELLTPSPRGELEISSLNCFYIEHSQIQAQFLQGDWRDIGENAEFYFQGCQARRKKVLNSAGL